jgi:hypothetical protein
MSTTADAPGLQNPYNLMRKNDKPQVNVMTELFFESLCTSDPKEKAYMHKLLNNKKLLTILLYRGSRDGWMAQDFHKLCDGK